MAHAANLMLDHLRKLVGGDECSDRELLERFNARHEDAVFAALLQRHGPLVLGVCQRVLNHRQDAEDAFQATFLVLARRAGSIRKQESLASWLYGVAYRVALKSKAGAARRRAHERRVVAMQRTERPEDAVWRELRPLLDQELHALPEKYRAPLVLCYLQGKSHVEAARELGWPQGSMSRRLSRGRELLRGRLSRRGVTLSAGLFATVLAGRTLAAPSAALLHASARAALLAATGQAVTALVSEHAAALAEGVIRTMFTTKLKVGLFVVLSTAALAAAAVWAAPRGAEPPPAEPAQTATPQAPSKLPADLALVPADAAGFARIAVSELLRSPAAKDLRESARRAGHDLGAEFEKNFGVPLDDVEAAMFILLPPSSPAPEQALVTIYTTRRPYSQDAVRGAVAPNAKNVEHRGKTISVGRHPQQADRALVGTDPMAPAVFFAGERAFVTAPAGVMRRYFDVTAASAESKPLAAALRLASQRHAAVAGFRVPQELARGLRGQPWPAEVAFLKPLLALQSATLVVDVETEVRARANLQFADDKQAEQTAEALETGTGVLKALLAGAQQESRKEDPVTAMALDMAGTALRTVRVARNGSGMQVTAHTKPAATMGSLLSAVQKMRESANRRRSTINLRLLGLAMHNYNDTYGHLPPPAIYDKNGKPLLSWRVALLPFLQEEELYKQFHLDELWDSAHNKPLLDRMPAIYLPLNVEPTEPPTTFFQVFTGKGTTFEAADGTKIPDILDGASNTLLVVEGGTAVPWTKPEDLPYAADRPLPKLGGDTHGGILALFADGSVRILAPTLDDKTLRALITRAGREAVQIP